MSLTACLATVFFRAPRNCCPSDSSSVRYLVTPPVTSLPLSALQIFPACARAIFLGEEVGSLVHFLKAVVVEQFGESAHQVHPLDQMPLSIDLLPGVQLLDDGRGHRSVPGDLGAFSDIAEIDGIQNFP